MKLFARSFFLFLFFTFFSLIFFPKNAFALTTPFRSASIIETQSLTNNSVYLNLNNCFETDGLTCDKPLDTGTTDLYFRDFGTYGDFGMPSNAVITKVRIKVVGKASLVTYVSLTASNPFVWPFTVQNCQYPSDLLTLWDLFSGTIKSKLFITNVINTGTVTQAVNGYCFLSSLFENKRLRLRINGSSVSLWSANIDNLEIAFDYDVPMIPTPTFTSTPTLTPTPTSNPTPAVTVVLTPTSIPKTPLILIPGIGGSELKTTEMKVWAENDGHGGTFSYLYPKDETVWLNESKAAEFGEDDYFDILRMKADGISSEANIAINGKLIGRAYQGTIDFFTSNGYTLNQNLFVFPYDWRKDIALTAPLLDQKINEIKAQTGSQKVDIVAHSMGGLVARNYIADATKAKNVRKLFTLGTPHLGSVNSLKALRYGSCLTPLPVSLGPLCLGIIDTETNDVVQNMISVFQLAPSQIYFNFYSGEDNSHPYPYRTEVGSLNYSQIKTLLTSLGYNTSLFNPSEVFHSLDNNLSDTNGVDVTLIAGSGRPTLGQIIEENNHKDILNINGDGTVSLFSASLIDYGKSLVLLGDAKVFYTNQEHGNLVASGSALNLVKNILEGDNQLPDGVSTQAYSLPSIWWLFSVHSPVNISVYDSSGNHTGLTNNGDIEANIPGSSYDTLNDAKFIYLPQDGDYTVKFVATDNGSFDFKIKKYEDDTVSRETLYEDIPLTVLTKAETQFDTSSGQSPVILLDKDGNGTVDQEINPSFNQAPTPTTAIIASSNSNSSPVTSTLAPSVAATSILQSEYVGSSEEDVLGAQIISQEKEKNTDTKLLNGKQKEKFSLINLLIIFAGAIVLLYVKLKR